MKPMTNTPSAAGLIEAVAKCLRDELLPQATGAAAFNVRVSASALDLAARELRLGPKNEDAERERLKTLLGTDGTLEQMRAGLCDLIESGQLTAASRELRNHLWATVMARLAVDQPGYSTYLKTLGTDVTSATHGESL
jgi:Domain of unknown function (DUF6285)